MEDAPCGGRPILTGRAARRPRSVARAFASLPYDDGSAFHRENEYFRNVVALRRRLRLRAGAARAAVRRAPARCRRRPDLVHRPPRGRRLARRRHRHQPAPGASRVLRRRGPAYAVVNMDMHLPAWRAGAFDAITAFNALHHTHRLEALVGTLRRRCVPAAGCASSSRTGSWRQCARPSALRRSRPASTRTSIGSRSGTAGSSRPASSSRRSLIGHSFNAVYEKRADGAARTVSLAEAEAELFAGLYRGSVAGPPARCPARSRPGPRVEVPVRVANRLAGPAGAATVRCPSASAITSISATPNGAKPWRSRIHGHRSATCDAERDPRCPRCPWRCPSGRETGRSSSTWCRSTGPGSQARECRRRRLASRVGHLP